MGIDGMRVGGGRCPPLVVAGLLLACFILVCNWWSISSENTELLRQIDDLSQQLKISADERDQCVTLRGNLEQRYKRTEDEVASLHDQLIQEKELQKRKEDSVTMCKSELDSLNKLDVTKTATLETLRLEKETINGQLEERKDENKRLQDELDKVQGELSKLKLKLDSSGNKKSPTLLALPRSVIKPSQPELSPVPEAAVKVSISGQQGVMYHGIPVLSPNPPGAMRQLLRFSVTMLKATEDQLLNGGTQNGGDQDTQNMAEAGSNQPDDNPEIPEDEDTAQESLRDETMKSAMDI